MNLAARVKPSIHLLLPSHPSPRILVMNLAARVKPSIHLLLPSTGGRNPQQLTKSGIRKYSGSRSGYFRGMEKGGQGTVTTVWPRPGEVPYDSKFGNLVNLIGHVAIPVRFVSDFAPYDRYVSTTVISVGSGDYGRKSLSIPVVFEGDLAHVVACHVKKNDFVFISGRLSVDSMKMVSSGTVGKFLVLVERLNFVEDFENDRPVDETLGFLNSSEIDNDGMSKTASSKMVSKALDDENGNVVPEEGSVRQPLNGKSRSELSSSLLEHGNGEVMEKMQKGRSRKGVGKKKEGDRTSGLWRDLVRNPLHWWDYRDHKASGLVKENFPDFKQKGSGESLWLKSAPSWVLLGLGNLACDAKDWEPKQEQGDGQTRIRIGKNDSGWRNLGENPDKWWDNRMNKRNPRAPDFKHKETGDALWLDNSPLCAWALSVKDGRNTSDGKSMTALFVGSNFAFAEN